MDESEVTTGEAARILGVSTRTVIAYIERGLIPVRLLPSGHRRLPRAAVVQLRTPEPETAA